MSFFGTSGFKKPAPRNRQGDRTPVYNPNLADLFRIRQMGKTIQQAASEIEQLKERISRLEEMLTKRNAPATRVNEEIADSAPMPTTPPLPIAELKELAAMAKRFK
ncbi:MAG: hypothetical protein JW749_07910 [Sedimentisphaerales bacterium]|nr:hypothetical protein [Sedimentisphaerales bacterium]